MRHQRAANIAPPALDQREHAGMHAATGHRGKHRLGHDLGGAGVGRMTLDHHRAAGRQRTGGVAPGSRERQRKVRRAKHRHRPDRALHQADFGARRGLAVRQRGVKAAVKVIALQDMRRKQPQLAGGAAALALQPGGGQAGFGASDGGDGGTTRLDLVGNRAQQRGALGTAAAAKAGESGLGPLHRAIDQLDRADRERMRRPAGRFRVELRPAAHPFARHQMLAVGLVIHRLSFASEITCHPPHRYLNCGAR